MPGKDTCATPRFLNHMEPLTLCGHLAVSPTPLGGIIRINDSRLTLICLAEGIATLFAHSLHLANLAYGLLELFHSAVQVSALLTAGRHFDQPYLGL